MTIHELMQDCAKKGLHSNLSYSESDKRFEYEIQVGSKSGTGKLYEQYGKIVLETRYQTIDEIESYDDIASVAWRWFINYKEREPFGSPDGYWGQYFEFMGWMDIVNVKDGYEEIKITR